MRKLLFVLAVLMAMAILPLASCAQAAPHSNKLTWQPPVTGGPPVTYNVKRGIAAGAETLLTTLPATVTTYTDTNGVGGTKYFYVVSASNIGGEGPNSNEVSGTFLVDIPGVVGSLTLVSQ